MTRVRRAAFLLLLVLAGALAACGGSTAHTAAPPPSSDPYTASLAYARCLRAHGVPHPDPDKRGDFPPEVRNLNRGRAFFGFKRVPGDAPPPGSASHKRYLRDLHVCEKRVDLARRISKIIDEDRASPKPGDL